MWSRSRTVAFLCLLWASGASAAGELRAFLSSPAARYVLTESRASRSLGLRLEAPVPDASRAALEETLAGIETRFARYRRAMGRTAPPRGGAFLADEVAFLDAEAALLAGRGELEFLRAGAAGDASYGAARESFLGGASAREAVAPARRLWSERLTGAVRTPAPAEFAVETLGATIRGVRYGRPGGVPVLMGHGFSENSRLWRDLARKLHSLGGERGYEIWMVNWRGHGRASHRSRVHDGDFGFPAMAEHDLPALLAEIHRQTGRRVLVVGHSMGGILSRAATSEHVFARVELAAPRDFAPVPGYLRAMSWLSEPVAARAGAHIPLLVPNRAPTDPDPTGIGALAEKFVRKLVDPTWSSFSPPGIMNMANLTAPEISAFREKVVSRIHSDLIHDFAQGVNGSGAADPAVRQLLVPREDPSIPLLVIAGELDPLAPMALALPAPGRVSRVWSAEMMGTGHVDVAYGERAAEKLAPLIDRFAAGGAELGPPGTHWVIPQ